MALDGCRPRQAEFVDEPVALSQRLGDGGLDRCEDAGDAPQTVRSRFFDGRSRGTISSGHAAPCSTRSPTEPSRKRWQRIRVDEKSPLSPIALAINALLLHSVRLCCRAQS